MNKLIEITTNITDGVHGDCENEFNSNYYFISVKDLEPYQINYANARQITRNDFVNANLRTKLDKGDVLFANSGDTIGKMLHVKENNVKIGRTTFQKSIAILKPNTEIIDNTYFYYLIKYYTPYLRKAAVGSAQKNLLLDTIRNFQVKINHLRQDQKKTITILELIDSKIALNNRINAELEAMAKTVYDYWFVQFDFPNEKEKPYKSSGGKMVWCEELKREVPEGWKVDVINNVIEVKDGTHDSPKAKSEGFRLITSKNLLPSGLNFGSANFISEEDYININKRSKVDTGDILFSMIGSIGVVYKVEDEEINFAVKNVALYKTSQKPDYKNYIYQYLKSYDMENYMGNVISGSIQKFISLGSLRNMPLLINDDIILKYQKTTEQLFVQLENNKKQNQQLSSLREWLLPMLMNGQVRVGKEVKTLLAAEPGVEYISTEKNNSITSFKQWTIGERTILAAYLIKKFNGKGFGRVMLMKLLFLIEYMCELNFDSQYKVNVAGPYDDLIREIELKLRTHKLYDANHDKFDNHVTYKELGGTFSIENLFYEDFNAEAELINLILDKFKNSHWDQCEIIATMYAVWNNRLIKGSPINDMALKQDFLNWDPNKEKYKNRLDSALTWMRSYEVVPKGWGKVIEK